MMATTDATVTTSQKRAREIMGANYFGVGEAIRYFGVNLTKQEIAVLAEIPFSEATLEECKDMHVLVAVFPLSILQIRAQDRRPFSLLRFLKIRKRVSQDQRLFYGQSWYNEETFAEQDGDEMSWQLVRKTPVENSTEKTWREQQVLLRKEEETPTTRVMTHAVIGHFLATGERLFEDVYVRCSDMDWCGRRVYVGFFRTGGLNIERYGGGSHLDIGLASARKSN